MLQAGASAYCKRVCYCYVHRGDCIRPRVHPAADTYAGAAGGAAPLEPSAPRIWAWLGVYSAYCIGLWGGFCAGEKRVRVSQCVMPGSVTQPSPLSTIFISCAALLCPDPCE
jgi:hypothetical protein